MIARSYDRNVFINCPFDSAYRPLFEAISFATSDCGYHPRCSLEVDDSSQVRIEKITGIIGESRLAVHDISRTQLDSSTRLPRFNMPLELGIFLGAKSFGSGDHKRKVAIILDTDRYRYQKFISDIAGQDIRAHGGRTTKRFARCAGSCRCTASPVCSCRAETRSLGATTVFAECFRACAAICTSNRTS